MKMNEDDDFNNSAIVYNINNQSLIENYLQRVMMGGQPNEHKWFYLMLKSLHSKLPR